MTGIDSDSIGKEEKVSLVGFFNLVFFFPYLQWHIDYNIKARADTLSFGSTMTKFPQFTLLQQRAL